MKLALWLGFGGGRSKHLPKTAQALTGAEGFSRPAWMAVIRLWGPKEPWVQVRCGHIVSGPRAPRCGVRLMEKEPGVCLGHLSVSA